MNESLFNYWRIPFIEQQADLRSAPCQYAGTGFKSPTRRINVAHAGRYADKDIIAKLTLEIPQ